MSTSSSSSSSSKGSEDNGSGGKVNVQIPWYVSYLDRNVFPDFILRGQTRQQLAQRLSEEQEKDCESQRNKLREMIRKLKSFDQIAVLTAQANEQHYEVPTEFFKYVMGDVMKYSCCYFEDGVTDLTTAEKAMIELYCERAQLEDGQEVLDVGCGWGSFTLYAAAKYPNSKFTCVSNSNTQREFIQAAAEERGLDNVTPLTCDINEFALEQQFDRMVSIEMFEHMKNYEMLLAKLAGMLKDDGKLFVHIFTHAKYCYTFDSSFDALLDAQDGTEPENKEIEYSWMAENFFAGGIMPSDDLLLHFQKDLYVVDHWNVNGMHYSKTAECWLANMDAHKSEIMPLFREAYRPRVQDENGEWQIDESVSDAELDAIALKWWVNWRLFFIVTSESWKYGKGEEWIVSHYLWEKRV